MSKSQREVSLLKKINSFKLAFLVLGILEFFVAMIEMSLVIGYISTILLFYFLFENQIKSIQKNKEEIKKLEARLK